MGSFSKCALEFENRIGIRKRIYPGFEGLKLSIVFRFQTVLGAQEVKAQFLINNHKLESRKSLCPQPYMRQIGK
jgi:hypothetical protein